MPHCRVPTVHHSDSPTEQKPTISSSCRQRVIDAWVNAGKISHTDITIGCERANKSNHRESLLPMKAIYRIRKDMSSYPAAVSARCVCGTGLEAEPPPIRPVFSIITNHLSANNGRLTQSRACPRPDLHGQFMYVHNLSGGNNLAVRFEAGDKRRWRHVCPA